MGAMKRLFSSLQEAEQAMQEYDPLAFENAEKIIEAAQEIALKACTPRPRSIKPREDQFEFCPCCGDIVQPGHQCDA